MKLFYAMLIMLLTFAQISAFDHVMYIVRHAEPDKDYYGLSDAGKIDADKIGQIFKTLKITKIYTSRHERARQTADIIAKAIGFEGKIEVENDLDQDLEDKPRWVRYLKGMAYLDKGQNAILVTHSPVLAAFRDELKADKINVGFGCAIKVFTDGAEIKLSQLK